MLAGGAVGALAVLVAAKIAARRLWLSSYENGAAVPGASPAIVRTVGTMPYRRFGATGLAVSEVAFGAWGIGSQAYGTVAREDSLRALARAEELGCNFVDTARVYGDSELVLGEFLKGRRSRWIVATKYSYQPAGMTATLEEQLRRLGTDVIDYYQLHSMPEDERTYEELFALKKAGKVRFVGVSLYNAQDIDHVLAQPLLDGIQVRFSLLDPDPFLRRVAQLKNGRLAVLVRSTLKEGFLTRQVPARRELPRPADQRHSWIRGADRRHRGRGRALPLPGGGGALDGARRGRLSAVLPGSFHGPARHEERSAGAGELRRNSRNATGCRHPGSNRCPAG